MPNRIEARSAKAALTNATGRLPLLRLFSTPLTDQGCGEQTAQAGENAWFRKLSPLRAHKIGYQSKRITSSVPVVCQQFPSIDDAKREVLTRIARRRCWSWADSN